MIVKSADGVPIAYTVLGAGAPIVLLHGFTETAASWREAGYVDRFVRAGRQVVLIDCRGHGGSGKPHDSAAYGGDKRARDVVAVLDALGLTAADLVGFSMGGLLALEDRNHVTAFLAAAEIATAVERFLEQQVEAAAPIVQANAV